jgi:NAD(P)-dependent dehydrogenase (short-subunit alcohol dehydrogenase family)
MKLHSTFHDLKGATVFITGGGSGIGAALTEGFMQQGAQVAFVQRTAVPEFVAEMTAQFQREPLFIQCDITDVTALQGAIAATEAHFGAIDVLVNNAANDARHTLEDYSVEAWDQGMAVNLRPHFFAAQAVASSMKARQTGSIINFSSISYMMGNAGYPGYVASKAAINGLTRALARELGPNNIRVNALMPGWVLTKKQMAMWATETGLAEHLEKQCLKEHLVSEDIVEATLFLASKASRMMTGQALVVDGGVVTTG